MSLPVVTTTEVGISISTSSALSLLELSSEEESLSDDELLADWAFFNVVVGGFEGAPESESDSSEPELDSSFGESADGFATVLICWAFGFSSSDESSSLSLDSSFGAAFFAVVGFVPAADLSLVSSSLLSSSLLPSDSTGLV